MAKAAESVDASPTAPQTLDPKLYINRELSWLEFNARVLAEAANESVPLYERLKFMAIVSTNLDEFFMVRVAGLRAQRSGEVVELTPDGMTPDEQLAAIAARAHRIIADQDALWEVKLRQELHDAGIALVTPKELAKKEQHDLDRRFRREIMPVLTPIAVDPAHPFPHVRNKSLNVGAVFERKDLTLDPYVGVVQVPPMLPRLIPVTLAGTRRAFVLLEDVIARHIKAIFPHLKVVAQYTFRVTRNFDIEIDDDEAEDLLLTLQAELRRRERGDAVRLEISGDVAAESIRALCSELGLDVTQDVYRIEGPLNFGDLPALVAGDERRDLRDEPFSPVDVPPLRDSDDLMQTIRERDVLLHHPYESFEAVVDLLTQAAEDPQVLAIKMTMYRTGGESPTVRALQRAAELGKEVTALVELKARFDEESNIRWARALERSGVNVMYGLLGMKLHAKVMLIVRQEENGLRRYVHLATGNYNEQTAKLYADLSLFTARDEIGEDATALFNLLTSYSTPERWNQLVVAPLGLHEAVLGLIAREAEHARQGRPAGIVAKMNSLVDADVIAALYAASRAGVPIELLVRGICCLRPGLNGVSENIRVCAVIDRFLEHARIFHFVNGGDEEVFCSSADWMPRNFRRRVEVMYPILDPGLKKRVVKEILGTMRADTVKGWELQPDGAYRRTAAPKSGTPIRSQARFVELAREKAHGRGTSLQPSQLLEPAGIEKLRRKRKKKKGKGKRKDLD